MTQYIDFQSIEAVHIIGLNMLDAFDKICQQEGWAYSLAGGTLLGAIRNKGFLPWDDDIDLFMLRPDYEQLVRKYGGKEIAKPYYFIVGTDFGEPGIPFARMVDVRTMVKSNNSIAFNYIWMDILPIDGIPETDQEQKLLCKKLQKTRKRRLLYNLPTHIGSNFLKSIIKIPCGIIARKLGFQKKVCKKLEKIAQSTPYNSVKEVGELVAQAKIKGTLKKETFKNSVLVDFCGKQFKAMPDWNYYLTGAYGDYMNIPAYRKQVTHKIKLTLNWERFDEEEQKSLLQIKCNYQELIRKLSIDILKTFDKICQDNRWNYTLFGETLFGAIKNNGFLPGNNKIQVAMLRTEYNELIDKYGDIIFDKPFYQIVYTLNGNGHKLYAKMQDLRVKQLSSKEWISIDIIPLDNLPNSNIERQRLLQFINKKKKEIKMYCVKSKTNNIFVKALKKIMVDFSTIVGLKKKLINQINDIIESNNNKENGYLVSDIINCQRVESCIGIKKYSSTSKIEFEGMNYQVINDYKDYVNLKYSKDDFHCFSVNADEKIYINPYFNDEKQYFELFSITNS